MLYVRGDMKSLWNDSEASSYEGDLAQRVYTSRLLGRDSSLVLHGGGNTSVKTHETNVFGDLEEILFVKGSGSDLETIKAEGFSPCRMSHLLRLAKLRNLSDTEMANELRTSMINPNAPAPSVEAILHAILPHKFVDHTHADALISITNTPKGEARVREVFGKRVVLVPYVMPGFKLARACAEIFSKEVTSETVGMVLMNHGLFTFGATAKESYERMLELVTLAEEYLEAQGARSLSFPSTGSEVAPRRVEISELRRELSLIAGYPVVLRVNSAPGFRAFASRSDIGIISQQGPATPDHVIRTKRLPLVGRDIHGYAKAYRQYFAENGNKSLTMLDCAPRVILDADLGLCSIGRSAGDTIAVEDIYRHTIDIILRASALESWKALPARDIFEVEYWDLEQAKLRKLGAPAVFAGEVVLISGAASGIGRACVDSFTRRGACVIALDISQGIVDEPERANYLGLQCDLADETAVKEAIETGVKKFGGIDMLVLNAGIFPSSSPISKLTTADWRRVLGVNLDATFSLMRECYPMLKLAPKAGRVVIIGSKNVPAPGPGAAAYSASKAAVNQLARVAALEWGSDGIRVNSLHPNMVFDTALWTEELLELRAKHYGLTVEKYKTNNVLSVEVTSADVAELATSLCSPLFAKTTGAQIPVDGGNDRVI